MKKLVTHNGTFHADDLFAIATIQFYLEQIGESYVLMRTRDIEIINQADYVFDVGSEYDPKRNRFDHHQHGGAGTRENSIPYASIGLAWKHFGMELCNNNEKVWKKVDEKLIQPIDADDVGIALYFLDKKYETSPYILQFALKSFYSTWNEPDDFDNQFQKALFFAKEILKNEIRQAKAKVEAAIFVEKDYEISENKKIIILSNSYPWKSVLSEKTEPLFVIYPRYDGTWGIEGVPKNVSTEFEIRHYFPESWAGLRNEELSKVSGISDARFCHNGRWMCVTGTKETALELAKKALLM